MKEGHHISKLGLERGTSYNNCNFSNKAYGDLDFVVISVKAKGGREIVWGRNRIERERELKKLMIRQEKTVERVEFCPGDGRGRSISKQKLSELWREAFIFAKAAGKEAFSPVVDDTPAVESFPLYKCNFNVDYYQTLNTMIHEGTCSCLVCYNIFY